MRAGLAQSVYGRTTSWTAGARFPAGAKDFSTLQLPDPFWGSTSLLYSRYRGLFPPEVRQADVKLNTHLTSRIMELYLHSFTRLHGEVLS
jgi:hypothetical protein